MTATNMETEQSNARPLSRLFILGAGFSKPAGLPLGDELLTAIRQAQTAHSSPLENEITEWMRMYPGEKIDLERVLGYSHRKNHLQLKGPEEWSYSGSPAIIRARWAMQQILGRGIGTPIPDLYKQFVRQLTEYDIVMTFNYDTLLEQACEESRTPYSLTPPWWLKNAREPTPIHFLKMHGSIDWYDKEEYNDSVKFHGLAFAAKNDPVFGNAPIAKPEPLVHGQTSEGLGERIKDRIYRVRDFQELFKKAKGHELHQVTPFMLPLAHDKMLGYAPVIDFWWGLQEIVRRQVNQIIIIGYSMPKHDEYAREAISTMLMEYQDQYHTAPMWNSPERRPIKIITKANDERETRENLPFLEPEKSEIWTDGFTAEALGWALDTQGALTRSQGHNNSVQTTKLVSPLEIGDDIFSIISGWKQNIRDDDVPEEIVAAVMHALERYSIQSEGAGETGLLQTLMKLRDETNARIRSI